MKTIDDFEDLQAKTVPGLAAMAGEDGAAAA
jgi:hypothetical protein